MAVEHAFEEDRNVAEMQPGGGDVEARGGGELREANLGDAALREQPLGDVQHDLAALLMDGGCRAKRPVAPAEGGAVREVRRKGGAGHGPYRLLLGFLTRPGWMRQEDRLG